VPHLSAGSTSDENEDEHARERSRTHHPWRRFFARQIDLFFVMLVLTLTLNLIFAESASGVNKALENKAVASVISVLVLIPFEAFLLGMFGGTLGKALYGITVHQSSGEPLGLGQAWWRSWAVAFRGLAMGMPLFSLFTMGSAYQSLTKVGIATWDRDGGFTVEHGRLGFFRIAFLVVVWCGMAALFFAAAV
jgi:uncharacterized RDD family membrane protein YckC